MDNLQGITYQTFEQDPVKYQKYEEVSGNSNQTNGYIKVPSLRRTRRYSRLYLNGHHQRGCELICLSIWTFVMSEILESYASRALEGAHSSRDA